MELVECGEFGVCLSPDSNRKADVAAGPSRATSGLMHCTNSGDFGPATCLLQTLRPAAEARTALQRTGPKATRCGHAQQQTDAAAEVSSWLQGYVVSALNSRVTSLAKTVAG
jgi:hypothetical protein